jgi:hypothetical protein
MTVSGHYRRLPLDQLAVDPRYQRPLSEKRVAHMANHLDERLLGTLVVSNRGNGTSYIIDGQQRAEALRRAGKTDAPCLVHEDLTPEEEAQVFRLLQTKRRALRPLDLFRAAVFEGKPEETAVNDIVNAAGFTIGPSGGKDPLTIEAVQSVMRISRLKPDGLAILAKTLDLCSEYLDEGRTLQGSLIEGIGRFVAVAGDKLDEKHLRRKLQRTPSVRILQRALSAMAMAGGTTSSSTRAHWFAAEIAHMYNTRLSVSKRVVFAMYDDEEEVS